jgi:hypothetical protein
MAFAQWLNPSKISGSGNDTVSVSALSDNTGRVARSTVMTFKGSNVSDVPVTVNQAGKPEFVTMQATAAVTKLGGTLTISGTSNSSKLTFSLGSGATLALTIPSQYTANSVATNNGAAIVGDPGAAAEYPFSITFTGIGENTSIDDLTAQLIVTDNAGHEATCTITQAAGDAYLSVLPTTLNLDWNAYSEGTSASATVTSNTTWNID